MGYDNLAFPGFEFSLKHPGHVWLSTCLLDPRITTIFHFFNVVLVLDKETNLKDQYGVSKIIQS